MIDKKFIESLFTWANSVEDEKDRVPRREGVKKILLEGVVGTERQALEVLIAEVEAAPPPLLKEGDVPSSVESPATPGDETPRRKRKRIKVYAPARRGYMRSTTEEGLGDEMEAMRKESGGTPFFDDSPKTSRSPVRDHLKKLAQKQQDEKKEKK